MNTKLLLPIVAGVLSATTMTIAAGPQPSVLPTASPVHYRLHETADGPDGAKQRDQAVSLELRGDGYGAIVSSSGVPDQTLTLKLDDGALETTTPVADDKPSPIEPLGFLVSLANHQSPIAFGETWNAETTVTLPGGDTVRIPLTVTASGVHGDDIALSANGNGAGTVHAHGHSAHATIDLALQASFHAGHLVSATTTRKATAHVPFRTITFTDTWTVAS